MTKTIKGGNITDDRELTKGLSLVISFVAIILNVIIIIFQALKNYTHIVQILLVISSICVMLFAWVYMFKLMDIQIMNVYSLYMCSLFFMFVISIIGIILSLTPKVRLNFAFYAYTILEILLIAYISFISYNQIDAEVSNGVAVLIISTCALSFAIYTISNNKYITSSDKNTKGNDYQYM
jgi:hypothetical protein